MDKCRRTSRRRLAAGGRDHGETGRIARKSLKLWGEEADITGMSKTQGYDHYTASVVLWYGTKYAYTQIVHGNRKRKRRPATMRTIRAFIRDAYRGVLPIRILSVEIH